MADRKVSQFTDATAIPTPEANVFLPLVDENESSQSNRNKKVGFDVIKDNILANVPAGGMTAQQIANFNSAVIAIRELQYRDSLEAINYKGGYYDIFADESKIASNSQVAISTLDDGDSKGKVTLNGALYDIANASLIASQSIATSSGTTPKSVAMSADRTRLYVLETDAQQLDEYIMSIAGDITSIGSVNHQFSFSVSPADFDISPDGTKLIIVVGGANDDVREYTFSTAWDASTLSFDRTVSISAQSTNPKGVAFLSDGSGFVICDDQNDRMIQYSTTSTYSILGATQSGTYNPPFSSYDGCTISDDGLYLFIMSGDVVRRYTMSVANDISTAGSVVSFNPSQADTEGIWFYNGGRNMLLISRSTDTVYSYDVFGAYPASGNFVTPTIDLTADLVGNPATVVVGADFNTPSQASAEFDLSTTTYENDNFSVSGQSINFPSAVSVRDNGLKVWVLSNTGVIYSYTLGTAWDLSTATYDSISEDLSATVGSSVQGMFVKPDGTKFYLLSDTNDTIYEYSVSTAWDLGSTITNTDSFAITGGTSENSPDGIVLNSDGTRLYIVGSLSNTIKQYNLSTAWDLTTISYQNEFSISGQVLSPSDLAIVDDSTLLVLGVNSTSQIWQYDMGTANDLSTASYSGISTDINAQGSSNLGLFFSSVNNELFVGNNTNDRIDRYTASQPAFSTSIEVVLSDGTNTVTIPSADFDTEVDCSALTNRTPTAQFNLATTNSAQTPTLNDYALYFKD